jgi:hypothetical protein
MTKFFSAPLESKPTPTPSMEASIRKANGPVGSTLVMSPVLTNAQFCRAAELRWTMTSGVPIIQRPRPGGVHLKVNIRSKASCAARAALWSFQGSRLVLQWSFWIENMPSITRRQTSCQRSLVPSSLRRE